MSLVDRIKQRVAAARERSPALDHGFRTREHYAAVEGDQHAGAVTYFAFLSVFPVLALAFFAVGLISRVFPEAQDALLGAIDQVLPNLVGDKEYQVSLSAVESTAGRVGLVGLAGVLYAGLGWVTSLRTALVDVFEQREEPQPGFVQAKARDLSTLVLLGLVLMASVVVSGVITRFSGELLDRIGLGAELGWLLTVLALPLGVAASAVLFYLMFRLLADPPTPRSSLRTGAVLGAVGFELLKQLSGLLLVSTRGQLAFQAFGIALILLVWINYFSKVVLYAAAWAHTDRTDTGETTDTPDSADITDEGDHDEVRA